MVRTAPLRQPTDSDKNPSVSQTPNNSPMKDTRASTTPSLQTRTVTTQSPLIKPLDVHGEDSMKTESGEKPARRGLPRWAKITLLTLLVIVLLAGMAGGALAMVVWPKAKKAQASLQELNVHADGFQQAAKERNLTKMKSELDQINTNLEQFRGSLDEMAWMQKIPIARDYWKDAREASIGGQDLYKAGKSGIEGVEPYADLLGFSIEGAPSPESETAQDRIEFVVTTLDKIGPQLDTIGAHLKDAAGHFATIDPQRYPEEFRGIKVRSQITQLKDITEQATVLLTDAKPLIDVAPYLLGIDSPRTYLVLFQNNAELRPTGGFLTAYSLLRIDKGNIQPLFSSDIYDLDKKFTPPPAPEPILKYLPKVSTWNLRDMNLSPDFKVSMETFAENYAKTGSQKFDGIVAVDTAFFVDILEVIGPVGVSGYGNFSAEEVKQCNCPQAIYELESLISYETPYIRENRKAVLGPLMHAVLGNAMGQPKEKMPDLVQAGMKAIEGKHVLMYFPEEEIQAAVESFNMGGRLKETQDDYLMLVDTNFAGAKADLFIQQSIDLKVEAAGDKTINTLTVTYKNPQKHDNWLNGDHPDWFRVYVPSGSKLLEASGSEVEVGTSEDLGKTVFDGFFVLRPLGLATLTLKYETPVKSAGTYNLLLQKQGGTKDHELKVTVNGQTQELMLDKDKQLTVQL